MEEISKSSMVNASGLDMASSTSASSHSIKFSRDSSSITGTGLFLSSIRSTMSLVM